MSDQPMDAFDSRLTALFGGYGDLAVADYDAAAIAHTAIVAKPRGAFRLGIAIGPRARYAIVAACLLLLALAFALVAGSRRPSPIGDAFASPTALAWSPGGGDLAFVVDVADVGTDWQPGRPSHRELWIANGNGGSPRRLATFASMTEAGPPIWTPDGRSLILGLQPEAGAVGDSKIVEVTLDGSAQRTLLDAGSDTVGIPALSPAGDRLLYNRYQGPSTEAYVLGLASGTSLRVATIRATSGGCGSWSPDGQSVLCDVNDRDANGYPTASSATLVVASDGSANHRIGQCCGVGWSSDGRALFSPLDGGSVYSSAADGTDVQVVPNSDTPWAWSLSPDRTQWAAATPGGLVVARPGSAPMLLTSDSNDRDPMWSPDGAWIAFDGSRGGISGVYAVPATGGAARQLGANAAMWDWRPGTEGPELAFVHDRAIETVRADRSEVRDLVSRTTIAGDPMESSAAVPTRIVLGHDGPDRDIYRLPIGSRVLVVQNRSDIAWTVLGGLTEKAEYCSDAGCSVPPGGTMTITPEGGLPPFVEFPIAPDGADPLIGFPVIVELETNP